MNRVAQIVAVALAVLGGVLAVLADPRDPRGLVFAVAALAAFGKRPSVLFGALALVGGLSAVPWPGPAVIDPLALVGLGLSGLALGLLGRELDRHLDLFRGERLRPVLVALAALGLALAWFLPDPAARLAGPDGAPLSFDALMVDPSTAFRLLRPLPAVVHHTSPLGDLRPLALVLSLVVAFAALAHWALGRGVDRVLRIAVLAAAALTGLVAALGLVDLLTGSVALDKEQVRQALTLKGSASGPLLDLALPAEAALRPWSRPWVDGLRLVAALLLAGAALWPAPSPKAETESEPGPWLPLALAAAVAALPFSTPPMALASGVVLGLGALVAGRRGASTALAPRIALAALTVVWIWGAIATTALS